MRNLLMAMVAALLLLGVPAAQAADPSDTLPPVEPLPPDGDPSATGLYLRGTIGYGFAGDAEANQGRRTFHGERIDLGGLAGGGIGLKLNDWFRTDITADYNFDSTFRGRVACPAPAGASARARFAIARGSMGPPFSSTAIWTFLWAP